jgi:hypothetical protein
MIFRALKVNLLHMMDIPVTFPCLGKIYNCSSDDPSDADIVGVGVWILSRDRTGQC